MKKRAVFVCFVCSFAFVLTAAVASAADITVLTREDVNTWIAANINGSPKLVEGKTYTLAEVDQLSPWFPPYYFAHLRFDGLAFAIEKAGSYSPHPRYHQLTQQHAQSVTLGADGVLRGYVGGDPFPKGFTASMRRTFSSRARRVY